MCVYVGSDVVLANLLYFHPRSKDGISFSDIENYCFDIKKALIRKGVSKTEYISFNINRDELSSDMSMYNNEFKKFQNRYYSKASINIDQFNSRLKPEISSVMQEVAKSL